jgi:hypothetical protein
MSSLSTRLQRQDMHSVINVHMMTLLRGTLIFRLRERIYMILRLHKATALSSPSSQSSSPGIRGAWAPGNVFVAAHVVNGFIFPHPHGLWKQNGLAGGHKKTLRRPVAWSHAAQDHAVPPEMQHILQSGFQMLLPGPRHAAPTSWLQLGAV